MNNKMMIPNKIQWGSIAVSLNRLSFVDRLYVSLSLAGVLLWAFPHASLAQSANQMPFVFEIQTTENAPLTNNALTPIIREDHFAKLLANDVPPKPEDRRVKLLEQYLLEKKSPLSGHADVLLEQYHYRLIIGISFAESGFCKQQIRKHNCWGIGGTRPETYENYDAGIIRANNLIARYHERGMTTPKLMRDTWVGWKNHSWIIAVNQVTEELEERGI